jgi:DNA polymerase
MERWRTHKKKWKDCTGCSLCEERRAVVLYRGDLPCRIAFVGEGPGESEDVLGQPFVGPAGILLDDMIRTAELNVFKTGFLNLVACIPRYRELQQDENGDDVEVVTLKDPGKAEIQECSLRFTEMMDIANPEVIVWVGNLSKTQGPKILGQSPMGKKRSFGITHPGALLRLDPSAKDFAVEAAIVTLMEVRRFLLTGKR